MKRKVKIMALLGEGILSYVLLFSKIYLPCVFKSIFKIPCPGCGLTRAFKALLHFQIDTAFHFHAFSIPIFLLLFFLNLFLLYDIWQNTHTLEKAINQLNKHKRIGIIVLLLSEIMNLYRYFLS